MELKTKDFAKALNIASIVIDRRNEIPILSHVKVSTEGSIARFEGTNLDQSISVEAPVANGSALSACFDSPKALAKLIVAGGADTATIDLTERKAKIRAGELAGEMFTLPTEDFPVLLHAYSVAWEAELGADAIDMILRVSGAMSQEETRYYLNGVFFHHVEGWTYRAVATDGHRLYMGSIDLPGAEGAHFEGAGAQAGIIIPKDAIRQLQRIRSFARKDAPIRFAVGSKSDNGAPSLTEPAKGMPIVRFAATCGDFPVEFFTKTIDGTFPDYSRVVPNYRDGEPQVIFRREDLRRALDGITAGMTHPSRAVKLTFDGDKLIIAAKWIDQGFEGKIAIPAKTRTRGGSFEVGFNGNYLRALLDAGRGEELVLTTADNAAPGSLVDPTSADFLAVLMPMRV
jgi:DNA polymerase-3 subunit beta